MSSAEGAELITRSGSAPGSRPQGCKSFDSIRFAPLPASIREIQDVVTVFAADRHDGEDSSLFSVFELSGDRATEAAFKAMAPGRRILHVATHGFFLDSRCTSSSDRLRGLGGLSSDKPARTNKAGAGLFLPGLALAGANHRNEATGEQDDGIVTAEEISAMDLSKVEWAVLSACDTGLGEIRAGEGVSASAELCR